MALIWCYSIQLKQPYYTWLQNPNGAHTMLTLISKIFPLHGTFHPFSSPENHLLILRVVPPGVVPQHSHPRAVSAKTECQAIGQHCDLPADHELLEDRDHSPLTVGLPAPSMGDARF